MPAEITEDLQDGHQVIEARGYTEIIRVFRATGLGPLFPETQLLEAIDDPDVPKIGDPYPGTGVYNKYQRCVVRSKRAFPDGCLAARIVVDYSNEPTSAFDQEIDLGQTQPTQDIKQISYGLITKEVSVDRDGMDLKVLAPTQEQNDAGDRGYIESVVATVVVGTLVFERTETQPEPNWIRTAINSVNETAIGPYDVNQLKFVAFDQESGDAAGTWRSRYQFEFQEDGWVFATRWHFPGTEDVPIFAPLVTFNILPTFEFSEFGLDFDDAQAPIS